MYMRVLAFYTFIAYSVKDQGRDVTLVERIWTETPKKRIILVRREN